MKKVALIVVGALLSLLGVSFVSGGALLLSSSGPDGTALEAGLGEYREETSALVVNGFSLRQQTPLPDSQLEFLVSATSRNGKDLFVGFAPSEKVREYLRGSSYTVVRNLGSATEATTASVLGDQPLTSPDSQAFWASQGSGMTAQAEWAPTPKGSSLVIMNADASPGIASVVTASLRSPLVRSGAVALLGAGVVAMVVGMVLVVLGVRASSGRAQDVPPGHSGFPSASPGPDAAGARPGPSSPSPADLLDRPPS